MAKTKEQIIIAGPCAVENKSQLYKTFKSIYHHIDVFRAGIWKGRTSPNNYPGYGVKALPWSIITNSPLILDFPILSTTSKTEPLYIDSCIFVSSFKTTICLVGQSKANSFSIFIIL